MTQRYRTRQDFEGEPILIEASIREVRKDGSIMIAVPGTCGKPYVITVPSSAVFCRPKKLPSPNTHQQSGDRHLPQRVAVAGGG